MGSVLRGAAGEKRFSRGMQVPYLELLVSVLRRGSGGKRRHRARGEEVQQGNAHTGQGEKTFSRGAQSPIGEGSSRHALAV